MDIEEETGSQSEQRDMKTLAYADEVEVAVDTVNAGTAC